MNVSISCNAPAKINLCLHVVGHRNDGYHLLDSVVVFADVADRIVVSSNDDFILKSDGDFIDDLPPEGDNLALRAALLFADICSGAAIKLTKNLPIAAGIGGGSADAAAVIHALTAMHNTSLNFNQILPLGADIMACLYGKPCRMQGIGDKITPIANIPQLYAVLLCPNIKVSTAKIFNALNNKNNSNIPQLREGQGFINYLKTARNDLQTPAVRFFPVIADCLSLLLQNGALLARMSGSGAVCFGIFKNLDIAIVAAQNIAIIQPKWWVRPCRLNPKKH